MTEETAAVRPRKSLTPKWSTENIIAFLETYQHFHLLWDMRNADYSNKHKREKEMEKLREVLIQKGLVVPDILFLRNKIKIIKTTYRQELQKLEESKKNGMGTDEVYEPKLFWFYEADCFLRHVVANRPSSSIMQLQGKKTYQCHDEFGESGCSKVLSEGIFNGMLEIVSEDATEDGCDVNNGSFVLTDNSLQKSSTITSEIRRIKKKRRYGKIFKIDKVLAKPQKLVNACVQSRTTPTQHFYKEQDEYDFFAQHIAEQLRKLPTKRFILLQNKIQGLVTAERMEHLTEDPQSCSPNHRPASSPPEIKGKDGKDHLWFNGHLYAKQSTDVDSTKVNHLRTD
uniref:MADF domain-containing protein n=1 Tax=Graphocephala atropunctata TaxID=36148 RepID=A0A1B6M247_9HEMI